ncbi:MAG: hypothetical protein ACYDC5_07890, partial [Candidatus Dormibacteria bacterium]
NPLQIIRAHTPGRLLAPLTGLAETAAGPDSGRAPDSARPRPARQACIAGSFRDQGSAAAQGYVARLAAVGSPSVILGAGHSGRSETAGSFRLRSQWHSGLR